jgi:membrane protein
LAGQWQQQNPQTKALPAYLGRAAANYVSYGARQAAALSYYAVFSVFPLVLLLAVAVGAILGPTIAQEQIMNGLRLFLPAQSVNLFQNNVADALQQGRSFGLIALAGLVWSGLGLFSNITSSLDFIFHVPARRSLWRQRLVGLGMAIILVVLVLTSFVTSGVLQLMSAVGRSSAWVTIGTIFLPLGLDMMIFALLFRYVPSRRVHWDAVWPAAIFGGIGWQLTQQAFTWYLYNVANYSFVYGSIATVIALLFWAYLIASVFLLSAELCAQLNEWIIDFERQEEARRYLERDALPELPPEVDDT